MAGLESGLARTFDLDELAHTFLTNHDDCWFISRASLLMPHPSECRLGIASPALAGVLP